MNRFLVAAALAVFALIVHFAVPFVHFEVEPSDEAPDAQTKYTEWPSNFADREDAFDPVPGASMGYALAGLILFAVGAIALWATRTFVKSTLWETLSAGLALLGGTLTIHAQALWSGRSVSQIIHAIMGTDGPSRKHASEAFSADYFVQIWVISPWIVLALAIGAMWMILSQIGTWGTEEKGRQQQATRHARTGQWVLVAFTICLLAPWSVQDLDDNTQTGVQDQDPFVFSLYDTLRIRADTSVVAKEIGEAGLEEYSELATLHTLLVALTLTMVLVSLVAATGVRLASEAEGTTGRMLENGLFINGLIAAALIVIIALGALLWHVANDRVPSQRAWAPLVAIPFLVMSLMQVVASYRHLAEASESLISDDFPEPIVYD